MNTPEHVHRFSVRARHDHHHARIVEEPSVEAAAIAFVEHLAPAPGGDHQVSVIVRHLESGDEHCFRIDLQSGEAESCG